MLRTALLCIAMLLGGWAAAAWLTLDFQVWTDEGARRLEVALRPTPAPTTVLQESDGARADLPALLAGNGATIVDFFYTHCETVCLSLGSSFQQLQAALTLDAGRGEDSGVRLLSLSFDGARDDAPALQRYARGLNADARLWRFARVPDDAEQRSLLARLGVVVIPDGRGDYEHNAALLVFDRAGRMRRVFDLAEQQLALDYARHLARSGAP
ncbi:SCO family protein [Melaminivora suipulveris]|uniref:SCO family protein n=1 Tax=Melaminivora suipulveris TaxID=2109913 RepID=A0A2R3Q9U0_9BURK|nr:SCO family protein [Melaminivora suipulveris]AVO48407.1 SCO family protein [Melaminivora suipulveris]